MTNIPKTPNLIQQVGFTLIELSIVLVIIGLIVGGVLTGQDLIKAAEIRATVGQYEKYNTAVNTFRTKYNGIPGDLLTSSAQAFGLPCIMVLLLMLMLLMLILLSERLFLYGHSFLLPAL